MAIGLYYSFETMKHLKCQIYGFLSLYILFMKTRTSLENSLDYHDAEKTCKTHGGLESNYEFRENNGFISVNEEQIRILSLPDGESAWISGYAEYLKFLSWYGCYEIIKPVHKKYIKSTFANCLNFCDSYSNKDISFVGLRKGYCYCIETWMMKQQYVEIVDKIQCSQFYPYNFKCNECTVGNAVSVFQIHKQINFDLNSPALKQCVYAKSISTQFYYKVSSCYKAHIAGFLCINDGVSKLNSTCDRFHAPNASSSAFSVQHKLTDWIQARDYCSNCSGKLVDELLPAMADEMKNDLQYWTGIFQSFKITDQTSRMDNVPTACLAVRRIHEKLVLDPDECSKQKKYLCLDWKDMNPPTTSKTFSTKVVQVITEKREKPENGNTNNYAIYIVVAIVSVLALVIIICIIVKCSKRKKKHNRIQESISISMRINEDTEKTTDNNEEACDYAQTSGINRTKKVKPNKPLRHTLKRQTLDNSYENFKLQSNNIEKSDEQAKTVYEDYDRIDLKSTRTKLLNNDDSHESHIYDHTTATDCEDYDTIKASKLSQQFDSVTYNTLQKRCEDSGSLENCKNEDNQANETLT